MNCKQYQDKLQFQAQNDAAARETSNMLKVRGAVAERSPGKHQDA